MTIPTPAIPNFDDWLQFLKEHKLRTYFNDHPCPVAPQASQKEVAYRWDGLTKWMKRGLTFWWYDKNWYLGIPPPFQQKANTDWQGLDTPVWGSHVFFSVTKTFDETVRKPACDEWYGRPICLSKSFNPDWVAGMPAIQGAEHPAHHRYPVHWTGDFVTLQASVESMVDAGVHSFKPYVHSDCGGDAGTKPEYDGSAGALLRWTAHCAYGSILRFHVADHRVWQFDQNTINQFRSYLQARHKLIPSIIAAANKATETGFPLVARCDLYWPGHKESASNHQYIFLDDILVAPIFTSHDTQRSVWIPPGDWQDAWNPQTVVSGPKTITVVQPNERIPMWHNRNGGLLIIAHKSSTRVENQDWSALTLEAFPSTSPRNTSRKLYERTGEGWTNIILRTDGNGGACLEIGAATVSRSWVVRLNLRPMELVTSASVDGAPVPTSNLHLEANEQHDYFPLSGAGVGPPSGAGAVAELHLPSGSHARCECRDCRCRKPPCCLR